MAGWAVCVCLFSSSGAQGGAPAKVHLHMWVSVWLWARVECSVCVCVWGGVSGWNLWVFVGELDDFYRRWFTRGRPCPGLFKTCWVPGVGYGARLQDHAKAAWGLTGVADADKVRKSVVFCVDRKNLHVSVCPQKVLALHLFSELSLTWENPSGFLSHWHKQSKSTFVWYDWLCCCLFILLYEVWGGVCVWLEPYSRRCHRPELCTSLYLSTSDVTPVKVMTFPSYISPLKGFPSLALPTAWRPGV